MLQDTTNGSYHNEVATTIKDSVRFHTWINSSLVRYLPQVLIVPFLFRSKLVPFDTVPICIEKQQNKTNLQLIIVQDYIILYYIKLYLWIHFRGCGRGPAPFFNTSEKWLTIHSLLHSSCWKISDQQCCGLWIRDPWHVGTDPNPHQWLTDPDPPFFVSG